MFKRKHYIFKQNLGKSAIIVANMPERTLNSENWVNLQRSNLQELGIQNPKDLVPDNQHMRAIAMDLIVTRYLGSDLAFDEIDKEVAKTWLSTQHITYRLLCRLAYRRT